MIGVHKRSKTATGCCSTNNNTQQSSLTSKQHQHQTNNRKRVKLSPSKKAANSSQRTNQDLVSLQTGNSSHCSQQQLGEQNDESMWIFGLINNIEQLLSSFTSPQHSAGSSGASTPSSSAASSPGSSWAAQSLSRSPVSRQIKFHEYKGPPPVKRQQAAASGHCTTTRQSVGAGSTNQHQISTRIVTNLTSTRHKQQQQQQLQTIEQPHQTHHHQQLHLQQHQLKQHHHQQLLRRPCSAAQQQQHQLQLQPEYQQPQRVQHQLQACRLPPLNPQLNPQQNLSQVTSSGVELTSGHSNSPSANSQTYQMNQNTLASPTLLSSYQPSIQQEQIELTRTGEQSSSELLLSHSAQVQDLHNSNESNCSEQTASSDTCWLLTDQNQTNLTSALCAVNATDSSISFEPDSEGEDTATSVCEIEPSISFSQGVEELLFSEFIDLQDVPMNVDESDWLKKFLPPCSMG